MTQHTRRQLLPFAALSASYFAHIGFFNPYLPLWLKDQGVGLVAISMLLSVQSATRLFAPYGWGWLSDHTGQRVRLLRLGAVGALLCSFGLWVNLGLWWVSVVLLLMFTHTSSMMALSEAAMAGLVSQGGAFDARRYGRVRVWGSLGFMVTALAAGAWFERFGIGHFPAWTLLTLLAVTASTWWLPDVREPVSLPHERMSIWPVLRQRTVQWLLASMFFHVLAHMAVYLFLSLYLDGLGYSKLTIGLVWAISVVVEVAWFVTQSRWLPSFSLGAWLMLCAGATVLRMGMTAWDDAGLWLLLLAQCLHALTFAAHHTVCVALLSHHFPARLRARGLALYTVIAYGFPGVLAGLTGGALSAAFGLKSVYLAGAVSACAALGCAWRVWVAQHRNAPLHSAHGVR